MKPREVDLWFWHDILKGRYRDFALQTRCRSGELEGSHFQRFALKMSW